MRERNRKESAGWTAAVLARVAALACAAGLAACGDRAGAGVHSTDESAAGVHAIEHAVIFGGLGETPGRFGYPRAMDADATSLWVVDKTARVQRIDPKTGACMAWWRMPEFDLGKPVGITVVTDAAGDELLYIADTHYSRVMVYALPERGKEMGTPPHLVKSFGSFGQLNGQFVYPTDVEVEMKEGGVGLAGVSRIFVSEYGGNDRVSVFDGEANFLYSFGAFGSATGPAGSVGGAPEGEGGFNRPQSIALVKDGTGKAKELLVTDSRNHRVGRFEPDGNLIAWYGNPDEPGSALGQFNYPYGIALLGDGTALISEYGNNRVQRIEIATGRGLQAWGRAGRGDGEVAVPWGVAVIGEKAFVLDTGNNRIVGFARPALRS